LVCFFSVPLSPKVGQSILVDVTNFNNYTTDWGKIIPMGSGTLLPSNPQPGGPVQFTLNLPADSYLILLTKETQVNVFIQNVTDVRLPATMANGDTVRVRGFSLSSPVHFGMVARRITQ
jgi:hypothetical protein